MNNEQFITRFIAGYTPEVSHNSNSSLITWNNTIYSYGTHFPIATLDFENKMYIFNHNKFSRTTSHHQTMIKCALHQAGYTENETLTYKQTGYHPRYYSIVSVQNEK